MKNLFKEFKPVPECFYQGLEEFLEFISGRFIDRGHALPFKGVSIDSRTIREGDLFFAIKGERFDGHDFVEEAFKKGAWGAVVERIPSGLEYLRKTSNSVTETRFSTSPAGNIIVVNDTLNALGDLAQFHRRRFSIPVVAISGSCGKTTTKEMVCKILSIPFNVHKNRGNYNNLIGLPLTLLGLREDHDCAVLELGISKGKGEMRRLAEITSPGIALLTNIGIAHLEGLKDINGVAEAKVELLNYVKEDGFVIINLDDPIIFETSKRLKARKITYGIKNSGDVTLKYYKDSWDGTDYVIEVAGNELRGVVKASGLSNMYNILASAATVKALGVGDKYIVEGLKGFEPIRGRMYPINLEDIKIIDDTYNANPDSMEASLRTLSSVTKGGRSIAVLGDMMELGDESENLHFGLGRFVPTVGINLLYYVGKYGYSIKRGAIASGMERSSIKVFETKEKLFEALNIEIRKGDYLLIKASRGMKMEELVERLLDSRLKTQDARFQTSGSK